MWQTKNGNKMLPYPILLDQPFLPPALKSHMKCVKVINQGQKARKIFELLTRKLLRVIQYYFIFTAPTRGIETVFWQPAKNV